MNKTIRIALLICSALIAALTGICICADRLRATEIRANFLRENAEQLRFAERIVAEQLQIFLTQQDALSPEKFNLHAKQRAASNFFERGKKIKGSHTNGPTCSHLRKIVAFQQNFIILLYKPKER